MNPKIWMSEFNENPFFIENAVNELVSQLQRSKKSFKIFAGEVYWAIYDHPRTLNAFSEKASKVDIEVIAGPVLSRGGGEGSPKIIEMVNNHKVKLFFREKRGSENHFRIIDDVEVIVQKVHPTLIPIRYRHPEGKYDLRNSKDDKKNVDDYIKVFEKYKKGKIPSDDPKRDFLCLRPSELQGVVELVTYFNKNYDDLSKHEIEDYWKQVKTKKEDQIKEDEHFFNTIKDFEF